jgi:hypothetical protein
MGLLRKAAPALQFHDAAAKHIAQLGYIRDFFIPLVGVIVDGKSLQDLTPLPEGQHCKRIVTGIGLHCSLCERDAAESTM